MAVSTLVNLVRITTATVGTGTITLGAAATGYQGAAGLVDATVYSYSIVADGANWEVGQGTYTLSGTTLTRTVTASSNSNTAINLSGAALVNITALAADVGRPTDVQTFLTSGTWTRPVGARSVRVIVIAPGGGGGAGSSGASGTIRAGGGGGGAGGIKIFDFLASDLTATVSVTVAATPAGGAGAVNAATGNGGAGGVISYPALAGGLQKGYATTNTDMGTSTTGLDFSFGVGHREMVVDWGYRSTHLMTVVAKQIAQ